MIGDHLARRGQELVTPTPDLAYFWFDRLNKEVFDGQLKRPFVIVTYPMRRYHGWCGHDTGCDDYFIHLSSAQVTRRRFLMILVHEMVHAWQFCEGHALDHGAKFWGWKTHINEVGLRLAHREI